MPQFIIYVKGLCEEQTCAAAYSIYDTENNLLLMRRKDTTFFQRMPSTTAHFCNELLAAYSAIASNVIPEGAQVLIRTNDKAVASWLKQPHSGGINNPQNDYYQRFWQYALKKHLPFPETEYIPKDSSTSMQILRFYALTGQ